MVRQHDALEWITEMSLVVLSFGIPGFLSFPILASISIALDRDPKSLGSLPIILTQHPCDACTWSYQGSGRW